ncbi:hypothetical protein [Sorangium sp. So ce131]|uniref:hypothetical protein n=1 Tax=Sorangium sp. So ce131 TaxID=3133282 RepID=UPI003F60BBDA
MPAPEAAPPGASEAEDAARAAQSARSSRIAEAAAPPQPPPSAEPAAPPQPPPGAEPAAPPQPPPSAEPAAPAGAARVPRSGHGLLQLNAARDATVYVTGVAVGPSNQPIEVRCGRFFVRLGEPTRNGTRWLAEGRTVIVKCGALTEVSF